jgi:hypothetical protein
MAKRQQWKGRWKEEKGSRNEWSSKWPRLGLSQLKISLYIREGSNSCSTKKAHGIEWNGEWTLDSVKKKGDKRKNDGELDK